MNNSYSLFTLEKETEVHLFLIKSSTNLEAELFGVVGGEGTWVPGWCMHNVGVLGGVPFAQRRHFLLKRI